jgi:hypothetical protein
MGVAVGLGALKASLRCAADCDDRLCPTASACAAVFSLVWLVRIHLELCRTACACAAVLSSVWVVHIPFEAAAQEVVAVGMRMSMVMTVGMTVPSTVIMLVALKMGVAVASTVVMVVALTMGVAVASTVGMTVAAAVAVRGFVRGRLARAQLLLIDQRSARHRAVRTLVLCGQEHLWAWVGHQARKGGLPRCNFEAPRPDAQQRPRGVVIGNTSGCTGPVASCFWPGFGAGGGVPAPLAFLLIASGPFSFVRTS